MDTPTPTATLPTGTWTLTPSTAVKLTIKKLKFITVNATVDLIEGSITVGDDGSVTGVSARLAAASFSSGNDKRDTAVLSDDFLDAENHTEITFESTTAEAAASGYRVDGTITVKGESHSLTLLVGDLGIDEDTARFTATTSIDRNAVGVDTMPSLVISPMIDLRIEAHASRAA